MPKDCHSNKMLHDNMPGGVIGVADYAITPKNPANYAITPTADYAITPKHPGNYAITPKYRPDYAIMPIKA